MNNVFEISNITKSFKNKQILKGIDLVVNKGDIIGLLGLNGEGKSTVTIGLADGLNQIGKKAMIALREPSLGPVMGVKGGAAGGGVGGDVADAEDADLHIGLGADRVADLGGHSGQLVKAGGGLHRQVQAKTRQAQLARQRHGHRVGVAVALLGRARRRGS